MSLRRFYIEPKDLTDQDLLLTGDLLHHVRDVCRYEAGAKFEVLLGDGLAHLVEVTEVTKRELRGRKLSSRAIPAPPGPALTIALSVPKLPKVDWIIEKCVELGVNEIRPFVSDYSFLRKVSEISENRVARWRKLVQGATQQSGRGDLLKIEEVVTLDQLLEIFNRTEGVAGLFPYEGEAQLGLREALSEIRASASPRVWAFVGSEGGFSIGEVAKFRQKGLNPVSLGDQILRVETACVALASVLKYELRREEQ